MDDLLLIPGSEARRADLLCTAEARAVQASSELLGQQAGEAGAGLPPAVLANPKDHARELLRSEIKVANALGGRYRANRDTGKAHDMKGSGAMHALSSEVIKVCLPGRFTLPAGSCPSARFASVVLTNQACCKVYWPPFSMSSSPSAGAGGFGFLTALSPASLLTRRRPGQGLPPQLPVADDHHRRQGLPGQLQPDLVPAGPAGGAGGTKGWLATCGSPVPFHLDWDFRGT